MEEAEVNVAEPDTIAYMEAPASKFENASTWIVVAAPNLWVSYAMVSQQQRAGHYKVGFSTPVGRFFMSVKRFSRSITFRSPTNLYQS